MLEMQQAEIKENHHVFDELNNIKELTREACDKVD